MIHIVFNEADVAVLHQVTELDATLQGEVVQIRDDYAVGPLGSQGQATVEERRTWWRETIAGADQAAANDDGGINDEKTVAELRRKLAEDADEVIWIWAAQNGHDVSGYYWLLQHLKDFSGRIFILYLNNLPFINDKGNIFYPEWLHEIPAKEFLKAKKLAREITLSEFETDPDEWLKLAAENKGVRRLEGGKKLVQHDYDFFDAELKKYITKDFQKLSNIFRQFYSKSKQTTGDLYMFWRIKTMVHTGELEQQGEMKTAKDFELRLKQ